MFGWDFILIDFPIVGKLVTCRLDVILLSWSYLPTLTNLQSFQFSSESVTVSKFSLFLLFVITENKSKTAQIALMISRSPCDLSPPEIQYEVAMETKCSWLNTCLRDWLIVTEAQTRTGFYLGIILCHSHKHHPLQCSVLTWLDLP